MISDISRDDYQKIKEILGDALAVAPAGRHEFVERACAGNEKLLAEVELLLAEDTPDDGFLEEFSAFSVLKDSISGNDRFIGQRIGSYRLEKEIGRGGMGVVFLAAREDFHQQAAIKLIKRGMDSDAILERFQREREILAALNHPYIARLLDGGTTADGIPYFVMEYVEGLTIDEYCKINNLSKREILELFRKVCEAVSFAHQKLIVHRDLKPSNILVTAEGTPKLLDFGIAKLLNSTDAKETQTQQRALTPFYASPEQISGAPVDTTSDVYSLGVVLYELLTGVRPSEVSRELIESSQSSSGTRPKKPSEALRQNLASRVTEQETAIPPKSLKGDLDNIVLKSLHRERGQRYQSVEQFSEDIHRHLEGLPILARKATFTYQGIKFIKRHKLSFAAAVLVLLTLLGGIIATTAQRNRADYQRLRAEQDEHDNSQLLYAARMSLAYQAWEAAGAGPALDLLEAQKAEAGTKNLRGFEWRLLWRLAHDGARILREPTEKISAVAFSPDGKFIAAGSIDGKARIWNAATGQLLKIFDSPAKGGLNLIFSPDGKYLVAGCANGSTLFWELETGQLAQTFAGHTAPVLAVAFSPDGQTLATTSYDHTVKLWKVETGKLLTTLKSHTNVVAAVAFSPDGKTLATGSYDQTARLWDVVSGRELAVLKGHKWWVLTVKFSPDGKTLATAGSDSRIILWDVASREKRRSMFGEGFTFSNLNFSPDGKTLAVAAGDSSVRIYETAGGTLKDVLRGHTDVVNAVAYAPDGKTLASGGGDHTVRLWNLMRQPGTATLDGHQDWAWSLAFSPDGQTLATASKDATVKLWNVAEERATMTLQHPQWVNGVAFSPDGTRLATASDDTFVRLWNPVTGQNLFTLNENNNIAECVAFSPDGRVLAAGSKKGDIKLWDTTTGTELATFRSENHNIIWSLAFSPDGKTLVSAEGGLSDLDVSTGHIANIWDVSTGRIITTLSEHTLDVRAVAFSPDGKTLVTSGYDRTIKFWDAATYQELASVKSDRIQSLAFSADGTRLVSASSNKTVKIWDAKTRQELCTLIVPSVINSVAFSPDDQVLAAASNDNKVRLWFAPASADESEAENY